MWYEQHQLVAMFNEWNLWFAKNTMDSSSTSGCWEGVNLPRKDKMGCGWCCKNQTAWSLRSNCNSLRLVTPLNRNSECPTKSWLVIFKRISSKLYSNLRRTVTNNRCVCYFLGDYFFQPASVCLYWWYWMLGIQYESKTSKTTKDIFKTQVWCI